ncbi:YceI family protein [Stenotrophomonas tumulicola]
MFHRPTLTLLLCLLPGLALAADTMYRLDPVHTRVLFAIEHAGFSSALGTVSGSEGELHFDPGQWEAARLDVRVPLERLDLGDDKWNKAALARNLLDGRNFPQARFVSTQVLPVDDTHARVIGQLTLRGVSREVVLDVTLNALKRHPMPPFRRTAGFTATTALSRRDFGITAWPGMIGDTVQLRMEVEAVRDRSGGDAETPAPASPSDSPDDATPDDRSIP